MPASKRSVNVSRTGGAEAELLRWPAKAERRDDAEGPRASSAGRRRRIVAGRGAAEDSRRGDAPGLPVVRRGRVLSRNDFGPRNGDDLSNDSGRGTATTVLSDATPCNRVVDATLPSSI
mmetsp:Transcript_12646/g.39069  ORF Transcript_12646/g.39069 Transcript_12646/m.39069 type:complete len:119 (+) Transcript_12646:1219-1575(+)